MFLMYWFKEKEQYYSMHGASLAHGQPGFPESP